MSDESEEDCDDLVAAVALKRKKTPSQYASILSHTLKAEIDIVKYAVINVDVSDNVPIQPVTSINIREKEIEDTFQRMPSDSQLAEKANAQQEQLNKLNEVIDQIKKEKDCPTEVFLNQTIPGFNVAVVILPCPFRFGRLRHSCPAQLADIVRGLATTSARRMETPTSLARSFVCGFFMTLVAWHLGSRPPLYPLGVALRIARAVSRTRLATSTSRRQNADPWPPDAASTASPKAAVSRTTCVSQNRTAATIRTRTQYGSWSVSLFTIYAVSSAKTSLPTDSTFPKLITYEGTHSSVWKTKYFPAIYSLSLVQRSVDKKPTNAFRVSGSATKGRSNIDTMPPLTPSHAD
uniref:(California timema) hypothetical protein n=1 Tax=Timema californicum TaxID=61474 RepID=A0A7R9P7D7_TIMCA|nr:unnamed protein product [Timema californicum]